MNTKRSIPRHIIIKISQIKDKENLKSRLRKAMGLPTRETPQGSQPTFQQKFYWPEGNREQSTQLSFRSEGKMKSFSDGLRFKELTATEPALPEILLRLL